MSSAGNRTLWRFLLCFALTYALLILPWPGFPAAYHSFFRLLLRAAFAPGNGPRELGFNSLKPEHGRSLVRIEITNRTLMAPDGSGPVRNLVVDTGGFWRATALLLALIVVTPVAWRRRISAVLSGCLWLHGGILLIVGFSIWNESRHVSLVLLSPFWQTLADRIQRMLLSGLNLAAPVLLWMLVTFRREDFAGMKLWLPGGLAFPPNPVRPG